MLQKALEENIDTKHSISFVEVLWVEQRNGIWYRKGMGRIEKTAWNALDRKTIDIVLGQNDLKYLCCFSPYEAVNIYRHDSYGLGRRSIDVDTQNT